MTPTDQLMLEIAWPPNWTVAHRLRALKRIIAQVQTLATEEVETQHGLYELFVVTELPLEMGERPDMN